MSSAPARGSSFESNMAAEPGEWTRASQAMDPAAAAGARSPDPREKSKERRLDYDPDLPAKVQGLLEGQDITGDVLKQLQEEVTLLEKHAATVDQHLGTLDTEVLTTHKALSKLQNDVELNRADMHEFIKPTNVHELIRPVADQVLDEKIDRKSVV